MPQRRATYARVGKVLINNRANQLRSRTHLIGIGQLELPAIACPRDEALTRLVQQQLQQELPELYGSRAREAGHAALRCVAAQQRFVQTQCGHIRCRMLMRMCAPLFHVRLRVHRLERCIVRRVLRGKGIVESCPAVRVVEIRAAIQVAIAIGAATAVAHARRLTLMLLRR